MSESSSDGKIRGEDGPVIEDGTGEDWRERLLLPKIILPEVSKVNNGWTAGVNTRALVPCFDLDIKPSLPHSSFTRNEVVA